MKETNMYYTTYTNNKKFIKPAYDEILNTPLQQTSYTKLTLNLTPKPLENLNHNQLNQIHATEVTIRHCEFILRPFLNTHNQEYTEFHIPKHSGGLRTIHAPKPEFAMQLTEVQRLFTNNIKCLPHTAAYAYVKGRSIKDANQQHQNNNSKWFLHLDLDNFFTNCTADLIYNTLLEIYPFYYMHDHVKPLLKNIIDICCLNGVLPQGSPMSPLLSNLVMVPIDYNIHKTLTRNNCLKTHFIYTRYADDFTISAKNNFNWNKVIEILNPLIAPFTFKPSKTHYGSSAGSNWNLGLMLNKDNNITIGFQKKKTLNAMLNNFLKDFSSNTLWSVEDTQILQGKLSFLQQIEPEYFVYIVNKYNNKYNTNYRLALSTILG